MDLGAIKLPDTSFPWQKGDTNTYIACHRLGWPGTESYNQCLNLPFMRKGDEVTLTDANGAVYRYRVSEMLIVGPNGRVGYQGGAGKAGSLVADVYRSTRRFFHFGAQLGGPFYRSRRPDRLERV